MSQPARWLWGLVPLALLWGAGNFALDSAIEQDVGRRAEQAVAAGAGVLAYRQEMRDIAAEYALGFGDPLASDLLGRFRPRAVRKAVPWSLLALTLGVVMLALRRPRPRFRVLVLRPRFIPFLAAAVCIAAAGPMIVSDRWAWRMLRSDVVARDLADAMSRSVGSAVLVVWCVLALGRRLRARGWPDWLGGGVGAAWAAWWLAWFLHVRG